MVGRERLYVHVILASGGSPQYTDITEDTPVQRTYLQSLPRLTLHLF